MSTTEERLRAARANIKRVIREREDGRKRVPVVQWFDREIATAKDINPECRRILAEAA